MMFQMFHDSLLETSILASIDKWFSLKSYWNFRGSHVAMWLLRTPAHVVVDPGLVPHSPSIWTDFIYTCYPWSWKLSQKFCVVSGKFTPKYTHKTQRETSKTLQKITKWPMNLTIVTIVSLPHLFREDPQGSSPKSDSSSSSSKPSP